MTNLEYFFRLALTLLIMYPFILLSSATIFSSYFLCKEKFVVKIANGVSKAASETLKMMGKEKENNDNP